MNKHISFWIWCTGTRSSRAQNPLLYFNRRSYLWLYLFPSLLLLLLLFSKVFTFRCYPLLFRLCCCNSSQNINSIFPQDQIVSLFQVFFIWFESEKIKPNCFILQQLKTKKIKLSSRKFGKFNGKIKVSVAVVFIDDCSLINQRVQMQVEPGKRPAAAKPAGCRL